MPHMLVEYTRGLDRFTTAADIVEAVYQGASKSELFNPQFIKTRALGYEAYQSGDTQNPFLHVTAKILSGRTAEQKQRLSGAILAELKALIGAVAPLTVTVEVVDIEKESHAQFLNE